MKVLLGRLLFVAVFGAISCSCFAAGKLVTIAIIPKGTTQEFSQALHAGAIKAQQELVAQGINVRLLWRGPMSGDDYKTQIEWMDNYTARRVDGLVLDPADSKELVASAEFATGAGVPVVVIDSKLQTEKITAFIGSDQFRAGQKAGEYLGKLMNGLGNAMILRGPTGSNSTGEREAGFLSAITNQFPSIKILSTTNRAGGTLDSALLAAKQSLAQFDGKVNGVFASSEQTTVAMLRALREIQKAGGIVKLVGFDAAQESVEALQKGELQGLMVQNPVNMGYLAVKTAVTASQRGKVSPKINSDFVLITQETSVLEANKELLHPAFAP